MRWTLPSGGLGAFLGAVSLLIVPAVGFAQGSGEKPVPKVSGSVVLDKEIQAIDDTYDRQRLHLERQRLDSLAQLAARQAPAAAAATYEVLFRRAITNNLFVDAAPTAEKVLKSGSTSPITIGLAHLVKIIAECDRGEHEKSLESLRSILAANGGNDAPRPANPAILTSEKIELCDLYYQRLIHSDQLQIAKKAFQLLKDHVRVPALADFVSSRLKRLDLVGKPAPAIQGKDLDGKSFNLADAKGKVVLVVFWASWCLPCATEIEALERVAETYRSRGFQIVGVNLDDLPDDGQTLENAMPNIRHFLLDYNVQWPTLINGAGDKNYAEAYGVTAIPANTLIGRDGTVIHLDLVNKNLDSAIARATAE